MTESPIEDLIARLERERQVADRSYNDALTAVDRAIQPPTRLPDITLRDDSQSRSSLERLGADGARLPGSIAARLIRAVLRFAGVRPDEQRAFQDAVIEQLRQRAADRDEQQRGIAALRTALQQQVDAAARFESLLVQYLQTITLYVDTKDRALGGTELRDRVAMVEARLMAISRELVRGATAPAPIRGEGSPAAALAEPARVVADRIESSTYVGFEDRFRGMREEIRGRVEDYVPLLASASDVVDIGCGRGELLDLLQARGVAARGVDSNEAMVALCRARGLQVESGDALSYLERQADASVGGLVAIQVVEHFSPGYLVRFLMAAHQKMRPGAPLVLETLNPACWMAFFECYIRDLTHEAPLHPDTLRYLVEASGFTRVDVQFRQPVRLEDRLNRVGGPGAHEGAGDQPIAPLVAAINDHADKLNARLFSSMDYAVIARR